MPMPQKFREEGTLTLNELPQYITINIKDFAAQVESLDLKNIVA